MRPLRYSINVTVDGCCDHRETIADEDLHRHATLGVGLARGRTFGPEVDGSGVARAVVVMNYGTWQTRFGGAGDIVGKPLRLNNAVATVMALGAGQRTVLQLVLTEGMSLVGAGVMIGFASALVSGRLLSKMLYGVGATDPLSLGVAALALGTVALVACFLPAWSATRVDQIGRAHV